LLRKLLSGWGLARFWPKTCYARHESETAEYGEQGLFALWGVLESTQKKNREALPVAVQKRNSE